MTHLLALAVWFGALWFLTLAVAVVELVVNHRVGPVVRDEGILDHQTVGTGSAQPESVPVVENLVILALDQQCMAINGHALLVLLQRADKAPVAMTAAA